MCPFLQYLLSGWKQARMIHDKWTVSTIFVLEIGELHEAAVNGPQNIISPAEDNTLLWLNANLQILQVTLEINSLQQIHLSRIFDSIFIGVAIQSIVTGGAPDHRELDMRLDWG